MKIQYASEFRPGKISWKGKEMYITKIENVNEKHDILYIDGKLYNSKIIADLGAVMVEIGAVPEEIRKIQEERAEKARKRLFKNTQFLQRFPATLISIQQILDWKDEDGKGFQDEDYLLRTMDGDGDIVIYEDNDFIERGLINSLKKDYSIWYDINYLDVRPIMFGHWKELPNTRKLASRLDREINKTKKQTDIIGKHD